VCNGSVPDSYKVHYLLLSCVGNIVVDLIVSSNNNSLGLFCSRN